MGHEATTDPLIEATGWVLCAEAGRRCGRVVQTVYAWIRTGKCEGKTIGGYRQYVKWNDVVDLLGEEATVRGLVYTAEVE